MKHISVYITALVAGGLGLAAPGLAAAHAAAVKNAHKHRAAHHQRHVKAKKATAKKITNAAGVVHINQVQPAGLQLLHGIGAKKAIAIVDYRKHHGDFSSINGLLNVKGISKAYLARLLKNNPGRVLL